MIRINFEEIAKIDDTHIFEDKLDEIITIAGDCAFHKVTEKQLDRARDILNQLNDLYIRKGLEPMYEPSDNFANELRNWYVEILNQDKYGGFLN